MAGKMVNEGINKAVNVYVKGTTQRAADSLYIGLYTDTTEPGLTATLSTITELPVANGYSRIQVLDVDWTVVAAIATALIKTFTNTTSAWGNVYGYFITDVASGTSGLLQWVEHFSTGPFNVTEIAPNNTVGVTAVVTTS